LNTFKKRIAAFTIATLFLLSIYTLTIPLSNTSAHTPPWTIPTTAYCTVVPGTVGVGQTATIVVWLDRFSPTAGGLGGQRFNGFLITITPPNGQNITIGPFESASDVASDFKTFTPDQVGTYTVIFSWPGNTITNGTGSPQTSGLPYLGDFFAASTSKPAYLNVQQDPITNWVEPPLPTDYWTRPIHGANRGWSELPSNWLKGSWWPIGTQIAKSAHIYWTKPLIPGYPGGIIDSTWFGMPADANDYESPWTAPIIMNGIIYYNSPAVSDSQRYGYYAVDLYTGQQLWYKNGTDNGLNNPYTLLPLSGSSTQGSPTSRIYLGLTQGFLKYWYGVNGEGVLSYLLMIQGSTWYFLDPSTGNVIFSMINVPGGTAVTDQDGNLLRYSYNAARGNILCWNVSQIVGPGSPVSSLQQQWKPPNGAVFDAVNDIIWTKIGPNTLGQVEWTARDVLPRSGYTMNVTSASLANLPGGITGILQDDSGVPKQIFGSSIRTTASIGSSNPSADTFSVWLIRIDEHVVPYSPFPDGTGTINNNLGFGLTLLLNKNVNVPLPGLNHTWSIASVDYNSQTFQLLCKETSQIWTYSLSNGEILWGPTASFYAMDFYGLSARVNYGQLILVSQYGGWMAGYNIETGNLNWVYNATGVGFESAYGDNMPLSLGAVAGGCAILYSNEHSPTKPLWRESDVRCVNLTDGTLVWKLLGFNMGLGVADGYVVSGNEYDNRIYCIGIGPSATTVSAPQSGISLGSSFTITGTVTDESPGTKNLAQRALYPNGVPAISDENQEEFMEYLYEQQIYPTDLKGVPVSLDVIDPNGNFVHLGDVTSDASGTFNLGVDTNTLSAGPGTYTVIASFAGSDSYGHSQAESAFTMYTTSTVTPTQAPQSVLATSTELMTYIVGSTVAIIIAIAIVGLLLLRKRP
jgi:hypothetical protein